MKRRKDGVGLSLSRVLGNTSLHNCAFACHNAHIAHCAGSVCVVHDVIRNRQSKFLFASKALSALCFSADGQRLAAGERGHMPSVLVWDLETDAILHDLKGHRFGVTCVSFASDGSFLVSVGFTHDRMLYVWSMDTGQQIAAEKIVNKVRLICSCRWIRVRRAA
jgi:WD40 repeat protein